MLCFRNRGMGGGWVLFYQTQASKIWPEPTLAHLLPTNFYFSSRFSLRNKKTLNRFAEKKFQEIKNKNLINFKNYKHSFAQIFNVSIFFQSSKKFMYEST